MNYGLTYDEKLVLNHLKSAWNIFVGLDKHCVLDKTEFVEAIHRAQSIIALRVARRVDVDIWSQPNTDD